MNNLLLFIGIGLQTLVYIGLGFYVGYKSGKTDKKVNYKRNAFDDKSMDEFRDTLFAILIKANSLGFKISITEDRNGEMIYCENIETRESCSISHISTSQIKVEEESEA